MPNIISTPKKGFGVPYKPPESGIFRTTIDETIDSTYIDIYTRTTGISNGTIGSRKTVDRLITIELAGSEGGGGGG